MEILITSKEKVTTDDCNWIFSVKQKRGKWENKWYYPDIKACYFDLLDYYTRGSGKEKLIDAFEETVKKLEDLEKCFKKDNQKQSRKGVEEV